MTDRTYIHDEDLSPLQKAIHDGSAYGWMQLKGTDICMDIYCECGAHLHLDGIGIYVIKCMECGEVWTIGANVELIRGNPRKSEVWQLEEEDADDD